MAQYQPEALLKSAAKTFETRDLNRSVFEDAYELLMPYRNTFSGAPNVLRKPTKQFDSSGQISAANFVNSMQSGLTPVFTRWAMLQAGPGIPEDKKQAVNASLEKITEQVFAYLNTSNFATASAEMYFEWGMGTGVMWCHEGDARQPLNFVATPISQMGLREGRFGQVDARFREYPVKARLLPYTWPQDKVKLSANLKKMVKDDPERDVQIVEGQYYDYEEMVWRYDVVVKDEQECIFNHSEPEDMCFTPRWMKVPGMVWGVGPFLMALADVKTLNKLKEFLLRGAAMSIAGVYTVATNGGINVNNINIAPNTFIPVERNGGENGPTIQKLDTGGNFQLEEFLATSLGDQIKKTMLDTKLPDPQGTPASAFEIAQRLREYQVDIGSAYPRGMLEYVQPLFRRVLGILTRRKLIELPDGFDVDGFYVQVAVVSPIAQAQKMEDVQKFIQAHTLTTQIGGPGLASTAFEIEKFPAWVTEMLGAPSKMLRDEAEAGEMQKMIVQMVAQMQVEQTKGAAPDVQPAQ